MQNLKSTNHGTNTWLWWIFLLHSHLPFKDSFEKPKRPLTKWSTRKDPNFFHNFPYLVWFILIRIVAKTTKIISMAVAEFWQFQKWFLELTLRKKHQYDDSQYEPNVFPRVPFFRLLFAHGKMCHLASLNRVITFRSCCVRVEKMAGILRYLDKTNFQSNSTF